MSMLGKLALAALLTLTPLSPAIAQEGSLTIAGSAPSSDLPDPSFQTSLV